MTLPVGSHQRHSFKRGIDFSGGRKKRHNDGIELRKQRRLQGIQKKRAIYSSPQPLSTSITINDKSFTSRTNSLVSEGIELPQFILDSNVKISETIVQLLMKSNSINNNTSTSIHVNYRVDVQAGNVKKIVVQSGVVPLLVNHLKSEDNQVREQSALCIGNIAGEMSELRDYVIQCGAIRPILENISHSSNDNFREKIVWSLSNLCRGKQTPEMNNIIHAFPTLIELLNTSHCETLINACWGLAFLTEDNESVIQSLIEQNLTPKFISFLQHENPKIVIVALRILGNFILCGHLQHLLDSGFMNHTQSLLNNTDSSVRSETCYLLSLVTDHGTDFIDVLISISTAMRRVIEIMQDSSLHERTEAIWAIFNIANKGSDLQLKTLVDLGALPSLCQNLQVHDVKIILLILESIENILLVGERMALQYKINLEECGGRQKLEALLDHQSDDVYRKANHICDQYFCEECRDEYEDEIWYH